jgi:hypothetical protein
MDASEIGKMQIGAEMHHFHLSLVKFGNVIGQFRRRTQSVELLKRIVTRGFQ